MKVVVTGAAGFLGKHLCATLSLLADVEVVPVTRSTSEPEFEKNLASADAVIHFAGINRADNDQDVIVGNVEGTRRVCDVLRGQGRKIPILFSSSIQAGNESAYGRSKLAAEQLVRSYADATNSSVTVLRLANVFGKWCKPNYNSVVATFCYNLTRDLPIVVNDPLVQLRLVYVDDVIETVVNWLQHPTGRADIAEISPEYAISVGDLLKELQEIHSMRGQSLVERVGKGLPRALYSTYISYLPPERFSYPLTAYEDARGRFVEFIKTVDSGQVSYLSCAPGITRGGHYHHTKTEKFLVVRGSALIRFHNIQTGDTAEVTVEGNSPVVVDTVPGWAHDITNIGMDELVVVIWANENFDKKRPDTISFAIQR